MSCRKTEKIGVNIFSMQYIHHELRRSIIISSINFTSTLNYFLYSLLAKWYNSLYKHRMIYFGLPANYRCVSNTADFPGTWEFLSNLFKHVYTKGKGVNSCFQGLHIQCSDAIFNLFD